MNLTVQTLKEKGKASGMPLLITLVVIAGTFPENDWSVSVGIDPPLKWVFNTLFENGLSRGQHILFPHGPLAFLMYPLSDNILLATLVHSLLKALLVFGAAGLLADIRQPLKWSIVLGFAYGISIFSGFNHLLLAGILLLYLNYHRQPRALLKLAAFFLTALAFYVKAYVAILSGTLFVSFLIYEALQQRSIRPAIADALTMLGFMLLFQLAMYHTPAGFFRYLWGMLQLAQDNSAAAALYPHNNWWWLALSLAAIVGIYVANRGAEHRFFVSLTSLSLFAAWKHAMAREDIFHVKGLLVYLAIVLFLYLLFQQKKRIINSTLAVAAVLFFGLNMKNSVNYFTPKYPLWSGQNLVKFVTDFETLKARSHQTTAENLAANRLPQAMLDSISNHSADIYPWDYSIAAINQLNWQPRVVIQSYAAYTSWLDRQNASFFNSEKAPEFIVWQKEKITKDINGGSFNSIDYRYLLNDEPQTLLQILSNYAPCISSGKFLLLKRRKTPRSFQRENLQSQPGHLNEWITVLPTANGILRCRLRFNKSQIQRLKSFFYKDEQFWIYLKLAGGEIHKYRMVPKNAEDGLWINPYFWRDRQQYRVEQIRFQASNSKNLDSLLTLNWETIHFEGAPDYASRFWDGLRTSLDSLLFESLHRFEQDTEPHWSKLSADRISSTAFSGVQAYKGTNTTYSCTFSLPADSLPGGPLRIAADAWIRAPQYRQSRSTALVISVKNDQKQYLYHAVPIDEQLIDGKQWNHIYAAIDCEALKPNSSIGVYFWNREGKPLLVDDFRIRISRTHQ